jgi:ABC-type multidrug transport system fused ATPase/permease subunit
LSTLKHADKILVLGKGGKMLGFDSHENLIKNCESYKDLVERQSLLKNMEDDE